MNNFTLIEHVQVDDIPLVSLYKIDNELYLFIYIHDFDSYITIRTSKEDILKYMEQEISLTEIISKSTIFLYIEENKKLVPIPINLIREEPFCNKYDYHLSYRSVGLKNYLKNEESIH